MMAAAAVETPVATIPEIVRKVRDGFNSRKTLDKAFRTEQLRGLQRMMQECRDRIGQALKTDLDKCGMEIFMTECNHCEVEVSDAIKQLGHWMAPESVSKGLVNMMNSVFVEPEPYGVVLVIAPWNYPFSLVVLPLIGAIAAGNACIIKPSELSAATSNLFCELLPQYLDHDCYSVISGGVDVSQAVLKERFDYIFYTGSTPVGKLVMKQAAENLTPVTLELGGKSPCIIANDAAIEVAAKRLVWGKCINSGQTCIAPDYVICPRDKQAVLVERCKEAIREFYGEDPRLSPDYGKVINQRHFNRLMSLIRSTRGNVVFGGDTDEQKLKINPTLITDVTPGDPIMEDEIFGPILPFVPVDSVDEAINLVNSREKPLAFYVFTESKALFERIKRATSSGAILQNETLVHHQGKIQCDKHSQQTTSKCPMMLIQAFHLKWDSGSKFKTFPFSALPFGGVGHSGIGAYHGKLTFDTFSHRRAVLCAGTGFMESLNAKIKYPPWDEVKEARLRRLISPGGGNVVPAMSVLMMLAVISVVVMYLQVF
ncbi:hypothetical protein EMCRGX_G023609 [Ephydatia muelleri]